MRGLKYDWREVLRDFSLAFATAALVALGAVHRGVLEFSVGDWKAIADAGLAALGVQGLLVLTPLTSKYGVGSASLTNSPWISFPAKAENAAFKNLPVEELPLPDVPQEVDPAAQEGVRNGVGGSVF
jgi:hypothetical protein